MLVLASTSAYRRELLSRLGLAFEIAQPDVDETPLTDERPVAQAVRLAEAKARAVASRYPDVWVIGSDQVAELNGRAIGKPGGFERATEQLHAASDRTLLFHTAACLYRESDGQILSFSDTTLVRFRALSEDEIERYLHAERPFDCAGSFKAEGLGIALFESIESQDPTALIGLPLIALTKALRQAGFHVP